MMKEFTKHATSVATVDNNAQENYQFNGKMAFQAWRSSSRGRTRLDGECFLCI
jgi:hypothetical protein